MRGILSRAGRDIRRLLAKTLSPGRCAAPSQRQDAAASQRGQLCRLVLQYYFLHMITVVPPSSTLGRSGELVQIHTTLTHPFYVLFTPLTVHTTYNIQVIQYGKRYKYDAEHTQSLTSAFDLSAARGCFVDSKRRVVYQHPVYSTVYIQRRF